MSDSRTTMVKTTMPASTSDSGITKVQKTLPYSMSSSIAIENSNKGVEQTTPKMIDASAGEVSNKFIFPITKNLVAPPFASRLVKARKR